MRKKRKLKRGATGICVIASGYTWEDNANTWEDHEEVMRGSDTGN